MKRLITLTVALMMAAGLAACSGGNGGKGQAQSKTQLKTQQDKFSYAVGMDIGDSLQPFKKKLEPSKLMAGLQDSLHGNKTQLTEKQKKQVIQAYVKQMQAQHKKKQKAVAAKNAKQSKAFLAKMAKKKGVKTTKDGLEYKVLKKGTGPQPTVNDVVTVNYKGKLPDGTVFDSSYKRGKPATFPVKEVIPGWSEALQLMHVGGRYRLFIPPKLAYGAQGAGNKIGPNQVLIFDVHLMGIKKGKSGNGASSKPGGSQSASNGSSK